MSFGDKNYWDTKLKQQQKLINTRKEFKKVEQDKKLQQLGLTENLTKLFNPVTTTQIDTTKKLESKLDENSKKIENKLNEQNIAANQLANVLQDNKINENNNKQINKEVINLEREQEQEQNANKRYLYESGLREYFTPVEGFHTTLAPKINGNFLEINNKAFSVYVENDRWFIKDHAGFINEINQTVANLLRGGGFENNYSEIEYQTYFNILHSSHVNTRSNRYKSLVNILNDFKIKGAQGKGLQIKNKENKNKTVIISDNVEELKNRLQLLLSAKKEGVEFFNEINAILKSLLNKKIINEEEYKNILNKKNRHDK